MSENFEKNILCIKVVYKTLSSGISGLLLVFFDREEQNFQDIFSTVIMHEYMYDRDLNVTSRELMKTLLSVESNHTVVPEKGQKIIDAFSGSSSESEVKKLLAQVEMKNPAYVENYIKSNLVLGLNEDKMSLKYEISHLSTGDHDELSTLNRIRDLTVARRTDLVQDLYGGDRSKAEKSVYEMPDDMAVINFVARSGISKSSAGVIFYNIPTGQVVGSNSIYLPYDMSKGLNPEVNSIDYYYKIDELVKSSEGEDISATEIDEAISRIDKNKIRAGVDLKRPDKISSALTEIFNKPDLDITCSFDLKNSLVVNSLYVVKYAKKAGGDEPALEKNVKIVDVKLVLSPTKGVRVSALREGDAVQVLFDPDTTVGRAMIDRFNLLDEDDKLAPFRGTVHQVKHDPKEGYTILIRVLKNIYGKSIEEQDVRVKTYGAARSSRPAGNEGGKRSLFIGIAVGIVVFTLLIYFVLTSN